MSTAPSTPARTPQQSAQNLFNDVKTTSDAIERGDWLSAGIGVTKVAMDVIGLGGDPLGSISSAGFGWLIGHIQFLREPFDKLLGDPNSIMGSVQGWSRAADQLAQTAQQYRTASQNETRNWTGAAADAYRSAAATNAQNLDSLSKVSTAVSEAMKGAGQALAEVRKAVIDTINQACNKIIMIIIQALAEAWGSFGASIAKGIAQSVQTAVQAAQKMLTKIQKLISTLQKVLQLIQKVVQLAKAVKQLLENIGGNANPGGGEMRIQPVLPTGNVNYGGNISGTQGIGPAGVQSGVNYQRTDGNAFSYGQFTTGAQGSVNYQQTTGGPPQLPPNIPGWGPSGPPPDRGYPASRVDQARWIGNAVQLLIEHGVDPSKIDTGRIAEMVNQGSGGNPHAVDFNHPEAQNGHPPKGLMQLTDPVFQQHQIPGHTNIYRPVDNLAAGMMMMLMLMGMQQRPSRQVL